MARIANSTAGVVAGLQSECPVKDLALTVQRLQSALLLAEREKERDRAPGNLEAVARAIRAEYRYDALHELIAAKRDHAITTRALSLEGALHQIAIASSLVDELHEQTPSSDENPAAYYRAKELNWLINWALYSVAGVLEMASGTPRDQLGVDYYMAAEHSPYVRSALGQEAA